MVKRGVAMSDTFDHGLEALNRELNGESDQDDYDDILFNQKDWDKKRDEILINKVVDYSVFIPQALVEALKEIAKVAKEDGFNIFFPEIVETPAGIKQRSDSKFFKHEWVDQKGEADYYYGDIYYPFGDMYIKVPYSDYY